MMWLKRLEVAFLQLFVVSVLALGISRADAQVEGQSNEVAQLKETVSVQQAKLAQLESRLAKLEEISRILGFDKYVESARVSQGSGQVRPSGNAVTAKTELKVDSQVLIKWKNSWWKGSVLELLPDGNVKIRYEGWDAKHDEVVPRSRLQLPTVDSGQQLSNSSPAPLDISKAEAEVREHYAAAHPEIREYILWTAKSFGRNGMWLNEDAFASLPDEETQQLVQDLSELLSDGEYGRHLCPGLARAGALKDDRLVPGLMKVAGYQLEDSDYDCRPKWMAVAALARQESDDAVPLLVGLVDHGNQNTRMWARAALSRKTGQDFKEDKKAWADWWHAQGHVPLDEELLLPWKPQSESNG
jgi:hypothetical protein